MELRCPFPPAGRCEAAKSTAFPYISAFFAGIATPCRCYGRTFFDVLRDGGDSAVAA